jgi:HEAT repeat protein
MSSREGARTAAELMAELAGDPEYVAQQAKQEQERAQRTAVWRKAERPLVEDLRSRGLGVGSVWDLVNKSQPYPQAVPVLLDHLQRPYPDRVREGIARALAIPEAKAGWNLLLDLFVRERDRTTSGPKWALACALAAAADDDVLPDVIALVQDERHGENRAPLLDALARSRRPEARQMLLELRDTSDLAGDVQRLVGEEDDV